MASSAASVLKIVVRMVTIVDGTPQSVAGAERQIVGKMRRTHDGARRRHRHTHSRNCSQCVRELLTIAGANVSVRVIARWSKRQRVAAITWANDQIAAWSKDKAGWTTSVFVPEHVSSANRGWRA